MIFSRVTLWLKMTEKSQMVITLFKEMVTIWFYCRFLWYLLLNPRQTNKKSPLSEKNISDKGRVIVVPPLFESNAFLNYLRRNSVRDNDRTNRSGLPISRLSSETIFILSPLVPFTKRNLSSKVDKKITLLFIGFRLK